MPDREHSRAQVHIITAAALGLDTVGMFACLPEDVAGARLSANS